MSLRALRGLELMCLTKEGCFELTYAGAGKYTDPKGKPVDDLMDMGCVSCGAGYYTRESSAIDFCPACGFMERKHFQSFQELQKWSNSQDWSFLQHNGHKAFGVATATEWRLVFDTDATRLEMSGRYDEVHQLL